MFVRPTASIFSSHSLKGVKCLIRWQLGLIFFMIISLNPLCTCSFDFGNTCNLLIRCRLKEILFSTKLLILIVICQIQLKPEADLGLLLTSKIERFVIIINFWKSLTSITKHSILDVAAALDPPLDATITKTLLLFEVLQWSKFWMFKNWKFWMQVLTSF